jgi:hypothetical protein
VRHVSILDNLSTFEKSKKKRKFIVIKFNVGDNENVNKCNVQKCEEMKCIRQRIKQSITLRKFLPKEHSTEFFVLQICFDMKRNLFINDTILLMVGHKMALNIFSYQFTLIYFNKIMK